MSGKNALYKWRTEEMEQETEYYRLREHVNRERNAGKLDSGMTDHPGVERKTGGSHAHHVTCKGCGDT